jgi:NADPH-dependent curcumin reductase CurA
LPADASFYEIGTPKKGETIFVSAASGAVGQLVCQLALHDGLDVIGSVGDDKKADFLRNEIGVKKVFNYKKEDTKEALNKYAPEGIDIFYDVSLAIHTLMSRDRTDHARSCRMSVERHSILLLRR